MCIVGVLKWPGQAQEEVLHACGSVIHSLTVLGPVLCTKLWRSLTLFWSSWLLKEETRIERKSCLLGKPYKPAFLAVIPGGIRGTPEVRQCIWFMFSFVNTSWLQKTFSPFIPTQEWRRLQCNLLHSDNSESLEGHFHTVTNNIIAEVLLVKKLVKEVTLFPDRPRGSVRCHCTQTRACLLILVSGHRQNAWVLFSFLQDCRLMKAE